LDIEVRERLIGNVVRLILFNESRKLSTKRAEIIANAIGGDFKVPMLPSSFLAFLLFS